jgi:hypothetical protein
MLAYTNRFLALATLIRNLNAQYKQVGEERGIIREQIKKSQAQACADQTNAGAQAL